MMARITYGDDDGGDDDDADNGDDDDGDDDDGDCRRYPDQCNAIVSHQHYK